MFLYMYDGMMILNGTVMSNFQAASCNPGVIWRLQRKCSNYSVFLNLILFRDTGRKKAEHKQYLNMNIFEALSSFTLGALYCTEVNQHSCHVTWLKLGQHGGESFLVSPCLATQVSGKVPDTSSLKNPESCALIGPKCSGSISLVLSRQLQTSTAMRAAYITLVLNQVSLLDSLLRR